MDAFEHPELHEDSAPLIILALAMWVLIIFGSIIVYCAQTTMLLQVYIYMSVLI